MIKTNKLQMNDQEYYDRNAEPWSKSELIQVKKEYAIEKMTVDKIAIVHSRLPDSIVNKLKGLGVIQNINDARGYSNLENNIQQNATDSLAYPQHQQEILQGEYTTAIYGLTANKSLVKVAHEILPIEKEQKTKGIYGLDKSKYPSRMGQAWADDEVVQLLKLIHVKKPLQEIAVIHQRTEGGIIAKLEGLAVDYHIYDKRSIGQIEKFTGLSKDTILKAITRKQKQDYFRNTEVAETPVAEPSLKEIMTLMKTIQHTMNIILEKLQ